MIASLRPITCATLLATVSGCATAPQEEVREQLDERTGVTITRLEQPLEFFSPRPEQGLQATNFAYFGPLEVNRMGARTTYLWLSVLPGTDAQGREPAEKAATTGLRIVAGDNSFEPEITGNPMDVSGRVYPRAAGWATETYFAASVETLTNLAAAQRVSLEIDTGDGEWRHYDLWKGDLSALQEFVTRISPP